MKLTFALPDLLNALSRSTKMKRAPKGSRATGLNAAALVPQNGLIAFELPGAITLVKPMSGKLNCTIEFTPSGLAHCVKVLKAYDETESQASLTKTNETVMLVCGGAKVILGKT